MGREAQGPFLRSSTPWACGLLPFSCLKAHHPLPHLRSHKNFISNTHYVCAPKMLDEIPERILI
ncbi:hypothetical protein TorRG33x02_259940 [Trema orientale]|uniref:Uncharacterized protein n=1 Tax=Trema orientale TaxID=63057 RepID=A0A2P5D779_TREOI|nr:hypothetical protein TorRG33x02_259940 [Trema orientale]